MLQTIVTTLGQTFEATHAVLYTRRYVQDSLQAALGSSFQLQLVTPPPPLTYQAELRGPLASKSVNGRAATRARVKPIRSDPLG
jgi:hypothetical protein